jgi:hypothetical protein
LSPQPIKPNPKLLNLVKGKGEGGAKMMDPKGKAQSVMQLFMSWISSQASAEKKFHPTKSRKKV